MQARCSALTASLVIGLVWALWHVPLFFMVGTSQATMSFAWFTVQAVALSIVLTWAYNGTGGSVLLVVLAHAALNVWYGAAVEWLAPATQDTFIAYAAVLVGAGALVVVRRSGHEHLARRPRQAW
jgi:uncharacterized protein